MQRITTISALALATLAALVAACGSGSVEDAEGRRLTLVAPANQTLAQGETNRILIAVGRTGVDGPVHIRFDGLPDGVSVVESKTDIPAASNTATFTLHADNDAAVTESREATVTAVGPDGMSVTERFRLDVVASK